MARSTDGSQRVMVPNAIEHRQRREHAAAQPEPAEQRREEREHEGDVLPRDRGQVGEAGGAELLGERARARRGCRRGGSRPATTRSVGPRCSEPARTSSRASLASLVEGRPGGCDTQHLGGVEGPDGVLPPPAFVEALERREPSAQRHPLARREQAQVAGDVARGRRPGPRRWPPPRPSNRSTRTSARASNRAASGSSTRVATNRASACRTIAGPSGDTSSPWSARCMAAPPSNANATSATPIRSGDGRSHHATRPPRTPTTSASDCGPAAGGLAREDADHDRAEDGQRPVRQRTVQRLTRSRAAPARRSACRRCRGRCAGRSPT